VKRGGGGEIRCMRALMLYAVSSDQKLLTRACVYESSVMCNGRNLASKV
jgi:hypothetical protein